MSMKLPPQITGNTGLYYVCYELSKRGWNVMPPVAMLAELTLSLILLMVNVQLLLKLRAFEKKALFGSILLLSLIT